MRSYPELVSLIILLILLAPAFLGFLVYHLHLVWHGTTTNEVYKLSELNAEQSGRG